MDLSTPEVEGSDLPGSPQEPAPAPTLASWMRPKPRGPVGAGLPIRRPRGGGGRKGCLAGAPLARRLVPGRGPHAAALLE